MKCKGQHLKYTNLLNNMLEDALKHVSSFVVIINNSPQFVIKWASVGLFFLKEKGLKIMVKAFF